MSFLEDPTGEVQTALDILAPEFGAKVDALLVRLEHYYNGLINEIKRGQQEAKERGESVIQMLPLLVKEQLYSVLRERDMEILLQLKEISQKLKYIEEMSTRFEIQQKKQADELNENIKRIINMTASANGGPSELLPLTPALTTNATPEKHPKHPKTTKAKKALAAQLAFPGMQLKRTTKTVPQLLKEWYFWDGDIPDVELRNTRYGSRWRGSDSFYKRRLAIINFIENDLKRKFSDTGLGRDALGALLEQYRLKDKRKLGLNDLGTKLQNEGARINLSRLLKATWTDRQE